MKNINDILEKFETEVNRITKEYPMINYFLDLSPYYNPDCVTKIHTLYTYTRRKLKTLINKINKKICKEYIDLYNELTNELSSDKFIIKNDDIINFNIVVRVSNYLENMRIMKLMNDNGYVSPYSSCYELSLTNSLAKGYISSYVKLMDKPAFVISSYNVEDINIQNPKEHAEMIYTALTRR